MHRGPVLVKDTSCMRLLRAVLQAGAHMLVRQVRGPLTTLTHMTAKGHFCMTVSGMVPQVFFAEVSSCNFASLSACSVMACFEHSLVNRAKGAMLQDPHSSLLAIMLARKNGFAFLALSTGQQRVLASNSCSLNSQEIFSFMNFC